MPFEVIPAIDVAGGRLARYVAAGAVPVDAHAGDPIAAARACIEAGARWLHVVDMDLAFWGQQRNLGVLRAVAALGARVQAAGAIIDYEEIASALDAGAERVVLGSAALTDLSATGDLLARFGEGIVVGIEVEGDRIRARGRRSTDLPLVETLEAAAGAGASSFVVTAVRRVGTLTGPDLEAVSTAAGFGKPVLAAGGLASIDDLVSVRNAGADGAIVGRAVIEGGLDIAAAAGSVEERSRRSAR